MITSYWKIVYFNSYKPFDGLAIILKSKLISNPLRLKYIIYEVN